MSFSEEGISSGGSKGYAPSLLKNYYGWWSSYQVQEVNGQSASVSVTYYDKYNNEYPGYTSFTLPARGYKEVYMGSPSLDDGHYSAVISVIGGSGKIVTAIHHTNTNVMAALGYHGFKAGARDLSLPYPKKNLDGWNASLTIQNVGSVDADINIYFYTADGNYDFYPLPTYLQPGRSVELYNEIPSGFFGSVQIHSEGSDIVVAVHQAHDDGRHFGYSAP